MSHHCFKTFWFNKQSKSAYRGQIVIMLQKKDYGVFGHKKVIMR